MDSPVYLDNKSILVSTSKGLRRIHVPFLVVVNVPVETLVKGEKVTVLLVGFNPNDKLLYYIRNKYYKYCLFIILEQTK